MGSRRLGPAEIIPSKRSFFLLNFGSVHWSVLESPPAAFTSAVRALLHSWTFRGHLEMRKGGAVLHCAGLKPTPQHYDELGTAAMKVMHAALTPG